jgi:hypothetical protein
VIGHSIVNDMYKLKVYYKTDMKVIEVNVKTKLKDLVLHLKKEFKLEDLDNKNIRLRVYQPHKDLMVDTFTGMDEREILFLGIVANKCYALERKNDEEEFGEYDTFVMKVKCVVWDANTISSDSETSPQFFVSISKKRPVQDFEGFIRRQLAISADEDIYIFKRRIISDSIKETCLINSEENLLYSLEEMKIFEATTVLVEISRPDFKIVRPKALEMFVESSSKWVALIEKENCTLLIRFNVPSLTPNSEMASYSQEILIDSRSTLRDLKKMISDSIEIEEDKFVIRRGGKVGVELNDLEKTLLKAGLLNGSIIYTGFGTPTNPGEILIKVLMTIKDDKELAHHYNLKPMTEIAIDQNSTSEAVIKKAVSCILKDTGEDYSNTVFRLREKHSRSLLRIYRNVSITKQGIFAGKQLVLENIDPTVQVHNIEPRSFLVVIQVYNPVTIDLEEIVEFSIDRTTTLLSLAEMLWERVQTIPVEFMECGKVSHVWGLDRYYGMKVPYHPMNNAKISLCSQPFFINSDGTVFL